MIQRQETITVDTFTIETWDTTTGMYERAVDGTQIEQRPLTEDEVTALAAIEAGSVAGTNTEQIVAESDEAVDKLVAVIEALNAITDMTNASINQNPAAVIKTLTRECKTIARQVNREARMTSGRTEDTDTGPVTDV